MAWLWSPQHPGPSPPESQLFLDLTGHCPKCWVSLSLEALVFGIVTWSAGVSPTNLQRHKPSLAVGCSGQVLCDAAEVGGSGLPSLPVAALGPLRAMS